MSVYSANRLNSIKENTTGNSAYLAEVEEAFNDTSIEETQISPMGFLIQLHENDMRMFDAAITTDFKIATESTILEGAQLEALKEEVEKATSEGIWNKIKSAITAIKNAILALGRKIRDKVLSLVKADAKIVSNYGNIIANADKDLSVKIKVAQPKKSLDVLKDSEKIAGIGKVSKVIVENIKKGSEISGQLTTLNKYSEEINTDIQVLFADDKEVEIRKADAEAALANLKTGKEVVDGIKKATNGAITAVKEMESAIKGVKKTEKSKEANETYKLVSATGKAVTQSLNAYARAAAKVLSNSRKIVLSFGFAARKGAAVKEAADVTEPILFAIGEASDLYVEQKLELI